MISSCSGLARMLLRRLRDPWPVVWNPGTRPVIFGPGSRQAFSWYLEGQSSVPVSGIDSLVSWLCNCRYLPDREQFGQVDHWQHPADFERLRKGDCEDHALWAWRKLLELGLEAHFYVGLMAVQPDRPPWLHAWVVYRENGNDFLLETTQKKKELLIGPLQERRDWYCPHVSIGADLKIRSHRGYLFKVLDIKWSGPLQERQD